MQIETQNVDKYPQVNVIERAYLPLEPVRPHYGRDTLIVLAGSLLFGLFCVWISEFLTRQQEQQAGLTLSGIHLYKDIGFDRLNPLQPPATAQLRQDSNKVLASPLTRELSDAELRALLSATNGMGQQLIGLLLSGLTLEEAAALTPEDFDLDHNTIQIPGSEPRVIAINDPLKSLFAHSAKRPAWHTLPLSVNDLAAIIGLAAIDSGLPHPDEISAEAIRHTYIVYLVRQGLRLSELSQLVGHLPPSVQLSYSSYSPPRPGCSLEEIEKTHPVLANHITQPSE